MKLLYSIVAIGLILSFSSCKRCFNCSNTCVTCVLKDTAYAVIDTKVLCSDSSFSTTGGDISNKDELQRIGYVCDTSKSTFTRDFCTSADGEVQFQDYFNKIQYTCTKQ